MVDYLFSFLFLSVIYVGASGPQAHLPTTELKVDGHLKIENTELQNSKHYVCGALQKENSTEAEFFLASYQIGTYKPLWSKTIGFRTPGAGKTTKCVDIIILSSSIIVVGEMTKQGTLVVDGENKDSPILDSNAFLLLLKTDGTGLDFAFLGVNEKGVDGELRVTPKALARAPKQEVSSPNSTQHYSWVVGEFFGKVDFAGVADSAQDSNLTGHHGVFTYRMNSPPLDKKLSLIGARNFKSDSLSDEVAYESMYDEGWRTKTQDAYFIEGADLLTITNIAKLGGSDVPMSRTFLISWGYTMSKYLCPNDTTGPFGECKNEGWDDVSQIEVKQKTDNIEFISALDVARIGYGKPEENSNNDEHHFAGSMFIVGYSNQNQFKDEEDDGVKNGVPNLAGSDSCWCGCDEGTNEQDNIFMGRYNGFLLSFTWSKGPSFDCYKFFGQTTDPNAWTIATQVETTVNTIAVGGLFSGKVRIMGQLVDSVNAIHSFVFQMSKDGSLVPNSLETSFGSCKSGLVLLEDLKHKPNNDSLLVMWSCTTESQISLEEVLQQNYSSGSVKVKEISAGKQDSPNSNPPSPTPSPSPSPTPQPPKKPKPTPKPVSGDGGNDGDGPTIDGANNNLFVMLIILVLIGLVGSVFGLVIWLRQRKQTVEELPTQRFSKLERELREMEY